jgi:hypothetical protein
LAAYPGFVLVIARDLADVVAAALLLAGLLALDHQRPLVAAASLTLAGLTRESTLILPLALAVVWAVAVLWPSSRVAVLAGRPASTASVASGRSRVWAVSFAVPLAVAWPGSWSCGEAGALPRWSKDPSGWAAVCRQLAVHPRRLPVRRLPVGGAACRARLGDGRGPGHRVVAAPLQGVGARETRLGLGAGGGRAAVAECLDRGLGVPARPRRAVSAGDPGAVGRPDRRGLPIFTAGAVLCLLSLPCMCAASNIVDRLVPDKLGDLVRPLLASPRPAHAVAFGVAP